MKMVFRGLSLRRAESDVSEHARQMARENREHSRIMAGSTFALPTKCRLRLMQVELFRKDVKREMKFRI